MQLTIPELEAARDFLRQTQANVLAVLVMFQLGGYVDGAQRATDIGGRIDDLIDAIEKLIATSPGTKP